MPKFPVDASLKDVINALQLLVFELVREGNHIAIRRVDTDGAVTPLTIPNHPQIKGSTLRTILTQSNISRDDFLKVNQSK